MQCVKIIQILPEEKYNPYTSSNTPHKTSCNIKLFKIHSSEDTFENGIESKHLVIFIFWVQDLEMTGWEKLRELLL